MKIHREDIAVIFTDPQNDVLQLPKRKISKIILGGILANMCVESHLRKLLDRRLGSRRAVAQDGEAEHKGAVVGNC